MGITEARPTASPKPPAAPKMKRSRGFSRLAEASAPVTEPIAITELSRPKPLASLPNSIFAIVEV